MPQKFLKYSEKDDGRIKVSLKAKSEMKVLYERGIPVREIGKKFGVSHTAVLYWVNESVRNAHKKRGKVYNGYSDETLEEHRKFVTKKVKLKKVV